MLSKTVLVVRKFDEFSRLLVETGFEIINFPTIETVPVEDFSDFDKMLGESEKYDGVFLTSSVATGIFLGRLKSRNLQFRGQLFVLGKKSKRLLEAEGFEVFFNDKANTASDLIDTLPIEKLKNKCFLFPCGNKSLRVIINKLAGIAKVEEAVIYKTVLPEIDEKLMAAVSEKLNNREIACICFFSPSGIENFLEICRSNLCQKTKIAAIGETTANAARARNLAVDLVSETAEATEFASGLIEYLRGNIE